MQFIFYLANVCNKNTWIKKGCRKDLVREMILLFSDRNPGSDIRVDWNNWKDYIDRYLSSHVEAGMKWRTTESMNCICRRVVIRHLCPGRCGGQYFDFVPRFCLATLRAKGKEFRFPLAAKYVPNKIKNCRFFASHKNVVDNGETGP